MRVRDNARMELEVVGPRVSVDRNGTGDRGGGQLVVKQGNLLVRTRTLERALSALNAIDHVQLVDLARLQASVRLVDGQIWNVQSEQGEDLTGFFRQVATVSGRPALLRDPPRISQLVRDAATPARGRVAVWTVLALLAFFPMRWLAGLAQPIGVLLAVIGVVALVLGTIAFMTRGEEELASLAPVRRVVSPPLLALALVAALAGVLGHADASERGALAAREAREAAEAAQRKSAAESKARAEANERRARADALGAQLTAAMQEERLRDAAGLREQLDALVPEGHPVVKQVSAQLEQKLGELDERDRVAGITRGIADAKAIGADPLACESGKRVGDTVARLRAAQPADAEYEAASRALEGLERCRLRVRARLAQSAEDGRMQRRGVSAVQVEAAVRRLGFPAAVEVAGRRSDVLRIEAREIDAAGAQRILGLREANGATFEAARKDEGWKRIELRGEKLTRDIELEPLPPEVLVAPMLETLGLTAPLEQRDSSGVRAK
jgi:hypothetical protein